MIDNACVYEYNYMNTGMILLVRQSSMGQALRAQPLNPAQ